jgi:hypothetical protein
MSVVGESELCTFVMVLPYCVRSCVYVMHTDTSNRNGCHKLDTVASGEYRAAGA